VRPFPSLASPQDINTTVSCSPGTPGFVAQETPCAVRVGVVGELIPEIHLYESFVSPEGPIPVADWVSMWNQLHSNFSETFEWHEFMSMASTFYTPDLSPFMKRWEQRKYARLHRTYTGQDGKQMYSVRMPIPNTGTLVEVVADHVDKKWQGDFEVYKDSECGPSNHLPYTQVELKHTFDLLGGEDSNSSQMSISDDDESDDGPDDAGLPLLLLVQISHPATGRLDDLKTYLEAATGVTTWAYTEHNDTAQQCSWSDVTTEQLIAEEDNSMRKSSRARIARPHAHRGRAPY